MGFRGGYVTPHDGLEMVKQEFAGAPHQRITPELKDDPHHLLQWGLCPSPLVEQAGFQLPPRHPLQGPLGFLLGRSLPFRTDLTSR